MSSPKNSYVISGPEEDSEVPKESLGKYFFDCLKKHDSNKVININAVTKEEMTIGRLLEDSIKFATVLQNLSVAMGDVITIISPNSINYAAHILGAFYAGILVNPLNPAYKTGEIRHALSISQPQVILCCESSLETVLEVKQELKLTCTVLLTKKSSRYAEVTSVQELLEKTTFDIACFKPSAFDYSKQGALIVLSSGTTGFPKGALITHENLRMVVTNMMHPNFGNNTFRDTAVLVIPLFHIYGIMIMIASIVAPMRLVVFESFQPEVFLKCVEEYHVTKLYLVPPLINFLANSPLVDSYDTSSIQDIICGGAPLARDLLDKANKRLGRQCIRQLYGMTEMSGGISYQTLSDAQIGSVGSLIPGLVAKVQILDTFENAKPLVTGELCFKGPMVMKGYLKSAKEVSSCVDEDGFYHSGDLGYYDEHHNIYVVDRLKELIKYKCFQVPPSELEALILSHPDVIDCGVIGIPDERAGQLPFAFVVPREGVNLTEKCVVQFVAERISIQKQLHGGVMFVDDIPKTASGKTKRRLLEEKFHTLACGTEKA